MFAKLKKKSVDHDYKHISVVVFFSIVKNQETHFINYIYSLPFFQQRAQDSKKMLIPEDNSFRN